MRTILLAESWSGSRAGPLLRRYAQFCVVGATGMVVDMAVLHVLASAEQLGWNLSLSKVLAAEAGLINNFIWNELWTFRDRVSPRRRRRSDGADPAGEGAAEAAELNRLPGLNAFNGTADVRRERGPDEGALRVQGGVRSAESATAPCSSAVVPPRSGLVLFPGSSTLARSPSLSARVLRFLKFNGICTAGIGLSVLLLNAQVYGLGWNVYVSNFVAIVLVSLWNFFLNLKFGWSPPAHRKEP